MIHHHHHHYARGAGAGSAILAMTIAVLIVWTVENAWPYLLAAMILAGLVLGIRERRKLADAGPAPGPNLAQTIGDHKPELRMTDQDREHIADALRAAGADGRLDATELDERLSTAYRAKAWGDVAPVVHDLVP